ncbi:hypothetical protein [Paracoccus laeviglucosivorans]|uniref:Uncharacterized protein n=1 Tax=Paracoccus laeviglucosivorans TaxID=1197861 RepID=A0A521DYT9_9RHOB|nr:hypothetical protein [Paracoccus laeviglucosivorans]SMO76782.1 hypothetical protein SAMN06265221_11098 [Paracoccus laeviglucosivorans]
MSALDTLRQLIARQGNERLTSIGVAASIGWLLLVVLFAWLGPDDQARDTASWLIWVVGVILPLALIWFGIWSAHALTALRNEADDLRATLAQMRAVQAAPSHVAERPEPVPAMVPRAAQPMRPMPARAPAPPRPSVPADTRQARLELEAPAAPDLTPTELFLALNFPDGPEDREAIRCLRLALADPGMARLIRAAQDVVTLLAGQGVYMDDLQIPETDPALWARFAEGQRGAAVSGLAVVTDDAALLGAATMIREDEVFRDVAHHFLRHFDKLLSRRAEMDDPGVLAVLAETRSGRAFILLAQVTGILGDAPHVGDGDDATPPEDEAL